MQAAAHRQRAHALAVAAYIALHSAAATHEVPVSRHPRALAAGRQMHLDAGASTSAATENH